jgi:hypothetical protein
MTDLPDLKIKARPDWPGFSLAALVTFFARAITAVDGR